jgi:hypothetical protein
LQDAEKPKLHGLGKTPKVLRQIHLYGNAAAFGKTLEIPLSCGGEPDFVEQRRMEQV